MIEQIPYLVDPINCVETLGNTLGSNLSQDEQNTSGTVHLNLRQSVKRINGDGGLNDGTHLIHHSSFLARPNALHPRLVQICVTYFNRNA